MTDGSLVRPLFDGPLDLVGDVHGESDALRSLLRRLGYREDGTHPEGRRLVFLGDLVDRGPDSPAVLRLVGPLLDRGLAQCVLGNHELNLLQRLHKEGNSWFFGEPAESLGRPARPVPQVPADEAMRRQALDLFRRLPIALERPDLRVVHACWDTSALSQVRHWTDAEQATREFKQALEEELKRQPPTDEVERKLALQNGNPVKMLTSGPERRVPRFWTNGKWRQEGRVPWWESYGPDEPFCVFGHYWRTRLAGEEDTEQLFDESRPYAPLGHGQVMCLDYSVGKRYRERLDGLSPAEYRTRLAALRWPERLLVFDDRDPVPMV